MARTVKSGSLRITISSKNHLRHSSSEEFRVGLPSCGGFAVKNRAAGDQGPMPGGRTARDRHLYGESNCSATGNSNCDVSIVSTRTTSPESVVSSIS